MARPKVVLLMSASLDGRTALAPGRSQWEELDDPRSAATEGAGEAWDEVQKQVIRVHDPQVMMLGSASIQRESDPLVELDTVTDEAAELYEDFLPSDVIRDSDVRVWLVTPDGKGRLRSGYKGTETPGHHSLHLVSRGTPPEYLSFLRDHGIPYLIAGDDRVDLALALEKLSTQLSVQTVLVIGGGRLNGALLRADLLDEINLIVRPEIIGGTSTPTLFDCPNLAEDEWPVTLERISVEPILDRFLWLRYRVRR